MKRRVRVLIVEDEELARKHLARALERAGFDVAVAQTANDGLQEARRFEPQIVLLDLNLPDRFGLDLLTDLKRGDSLCEVIVNTGVSDVDTAVTAMRAGAFDYIVKPLNVDAILLTIQRVIETHDLKREHRFLLEQYESQFSLAHVGIHSPVLAQVFEDAARYAPRELPVLIEGDSGTGKELVARHLHAHSLPDGAGSGPFIPINCGALPASLAESELFGYASGAFTGAERKGKPGKITLANRGTIFLDEVGELLPEIQSKLLRFLQEKRFFPVGGTREMELDVKVICATNRDLAEEVAAGRFRKDLFFRINVGRIKVPPLRDRVSEILPLARQFLKEFCESYNRPAVEIDPEAGGMLEAHDWPGNVRELRNLCERIVLVTEGGAVSVDQLARLGLGVVEAPAASCPPPVSCTVVDPEHPFKAPLCPKTMCASKNCLPEEAFDLEDHINALVTSAYDKNEQNQSRTARYLGITREVLRHRLKKLGLIGV